jgi:hypothetical protein
MADVGIWIKNANIQARAGANASATAKATAATDVYVLDVEAFINDACLYNFSDKYASLNDDVKFLLMDVGACICAMYVISYDMSNFSSRSEAQTMLDFLDSRYKAGLEILRAKVTQTFMGC